MDSQEATVLNLHPESRFERAAAGSPMHPAIGERIQGFEVVGLAADQGAESDLYIVRGSDGEQCVLKLYRSGVQPATAVDEMHLCHPRIASPLLTSAWNGRPYEIASFFECGSLPHLIHKHPPLPPPTPKFIPRHLPYGFPSF